MKLQSYAHVGAWMMSAALAAPVLAHDAEGNAEPLTAEKVIVRGDKDGKAKPAEEKRATTTETKTIEEIKDTTSVVNAEDALRYFPNVFVRKRHVGDTQAPITTRTSGVGASARSLVFVDGVLVSALIGNNNSNASPKWGMITPEEIARIDVLYGPFSAAFAGNSIGAVVEIESRMPDAFEGSLTGVGTLQDFSQYGTDDTFGARQFRATIGDRFGDVSFWLSASRTDSDSQPLAYATATRPASPSATGTVLAGAFDTVNRTGTPIVVLGAGGFEHQVQDNIKAKVAYDFDAATSIAYTIGRFANDTTSDVETYLRNASGQPAFAGGPFNINGYAYTSIAASTFSNNVYDFEEEHWMQSVVLQRNSGGAFDWRIVASQYDYDDSTQRLPSTAMPGALSGGAGSITHFDGTGWWTLDAKGIWRPDADHEISFGLHGDAYELANRRYATTNWISGPEGTLASASLGKTSTQALWAQDAWQIDPSLLLVTGLRYEMWEATDGQNFSSSPALNVAQPELDADRLSPKASLQWTFAPEWSAQLSLGRAYRFPTVGELYQAITTGATLTVPNPNLKPERALSTELSLQRTFTNGRVRLSLFTEDINDALISQSAPLVIGSPTLYNYVQNVDKVESRGVELVAAYDDALIEGLSLTGSVTYVDPQIAKDTAFPAAAGKQVPQVPHWRSTLVATYRPDTQWSFTLAGRYSDRVYATIDNTDIVTHTYQGFDSYVVLDARATYDIDEHWTASLGVENLNNDDYILFHPFPQRTGTAELQFRF